MTANLTEADVVRIAGQVVREHETALHPTGTSNPQLLTFQATARVIHAGSQLSVVHCDWALLADFVLSWAQPYDDGDDDTSWTINGAVVQREYLAPKVYACSCRISGPAVSHRYQVMKAASLLEGPAFLPPSRIGLGLDLDAIDGSSPLMLNITASAAKTYRKGPYLSKTRFWRAAGSLGVHTYITARVGTPCLEVTTVLSCAAVDLTNGISFGGKRYDMGAHFIVPVGWEYQEIHGRTYQTGVQVRSARSVIVRRYVVFPVGTHPEEISAFVNMHYLGVAVSGKTYTAVEAYLAQRTMLPAIPSAQTKQYWASKALGLFTLAQTRSADSNQGVYTPPLGDYHPFETGNNADPGGAFIQTVYGSLCREFVLWAVLSNDMKQEGSAYFAFNAANGEPISCKDFAAANHTAYQPFSYDLAAHGGGISGFPAQQQNFFNKQANTATCLYEVTLNYWLEPEDGQHWCRETAIAKALAWIADDSFAIDCLRMSAQAVRWAWSEIGTYYDGYYYAGHDLKDMLNGRPPNNMQPGFPGVIAQPGVGLGYGRELAWVADAGCLGMLVEQDQVKRNDLFGWLVALKKLFDLGRMPNGLLQRVVFPGGGGLASAWTTYGVPANQDVAQNIEVPMTVHGWWCLSLALQDTAGLEQAVVTVAKNIFEADFANWAYPEWASSSKGPSKWIGVAPNGGKPYRNTTLGWGPGNPVNFPVMLEYAYRATHSSVWLDYARKFNAADANKTYAQLAADIIAGPSGFNEGLGAYLLKAANAPTS